ARRGPVPACRGTGTDSAPGLQVVAQTLRIACGTDQRHNIPPHLCGHGDLVLCQGFKQGCLYLGEGAVDFVGQDEIAAERAGLELEGAATVGSLGHWREDRPPIIFHAHDGPAMPHGWRLSMSGDASYH